MSDQLVGGRRIRVLTVIDTFSRRSPAVHVRRPYRGSDVVETLERITEEHRYWSVVENCRNPDGSNLPKK